MAQNIRSIKVEDDIIDGAENSNVTVPNNSRTEADLQDSFESKRPRRFFACRGEGHSVLNLVSSIRDILLNSVGKTSRKVYRATDHELECSKCGTVNEAQERKECGKFSTRPVVLYTLHHDSIPIEVVDVSCSNCDEVIRFNGEWEGLFSSSRNDVYTRELLDSWTYEVCGKGSTFRDTFDLWFERSHSVTATAHRLGSARVVGRRQANYEFS